MTPGDLIGSMDVTLHAYPNADDRKKRTLTI